MSAHPLSQFEYCPRCGREGFSERNAKSKECPGCGFVYYFNPSAAVGCFISDAVGNLLVAIRGAEPAKGTYDLVGGFTDPGESAEQAAEREILEETGLVLENLRYLFSEPNIYPYSGFEVHTLDIFFEGSVDCFDNVKAMDDVSELKVISVSELDPSLFGLASVRRAVEKYLLNNY